MTNLEAMLLEAAGRTNTSARKNHSRMSARWQQEDSCYDGSVSNDDDSRFSKGKHSASRVPLKKRFEPPKNDRSCRINDNSDNDNFDKSCGDESDSAPSVGSDLYKDDKDKEELGKMTELDREMILTERSIKIDDYWLKRKARESSSKAEYLAKESPPPLSSRSRLSVRSDKSSAKSVALQELRARRKKQQDPEGYCKLKDLAAGGTSFADDIVEDSSDSNVEISDDGKEDKLPENNDVGDNLDDLLTSNSKPLGFEDAKEITIRRSRLVKWFMEPFFEDIIVGCFVRVAVAQTSTGQRYRLCLVNSVDTSGPDRQYSLQGRMTQKWLNCTWGSDAAAARWQMAVVSDSPPLEDEFMEWVAEVECCKGKIPNCKDVNIKKEKIKEISNFVYSAQTVKQMLEQKKSTTARPLNVAAEKDRLRKEIEEAELRGESSTAKNLETELKELVESSRLSKQIDAKAIRLAEMNRKNKAENFRNASERKPVNTSLKAGEEGYDPFSRRWTRSRNYYLSKPTEDVNGASVDGENASAIALSGGNNDLEVANGADVGMAATAAALVAAAGAGKLVDTNAPVDQGTVSNLLHNFDLPISLAGLHSLRGPHGVYQGFMARKQKIEATIGCKVPDNDGKRHSLTLSVSDYKRRRGLL